MLIDGISGRAQTGTLSVGQSSGGMPALEDGQVINAKVLVNENGNAVLKTQDGFILRAKLETDLPLPPGTQTLLVVSGQKDGTPVLKVDESTMLYDAGKASGSGASALYSDKTLGPVARELSALNLPVTEHTVNLAARIMSENPGMTIREAAFLAANEINAEPALRDAVANLLSNGQKVADFLGELKALVGQMAIADSVSGEPAVQDANLQNAAVSTAVSETLVTPGQVNSNLADWLVSVLELEQPTAVQEQTNSSQATPEQTAPQVQAQAVPEQAAPQVQAQAVPEQAAPQVQAQAVPEQAAPQVQAQVVPEQAASRLQTQAAAEQAAPQVQAQTVAEQAAPRLQTQIAPEQIVQQTQVQTPEQSEPGLQRTLFSLLSQTEAFEGVPERNIAKLSEILANCARDAVAPNSADFPQKLAAFVDSMFTKLDGLKDGGDRLRAAKEELTARLTLMSETLAKAQVPGKEAVIEQTQKLLEHVKLLENVNQFYYAQIPVTLNGKEKTAELYVYKNKKGSKKIDPENVNILLALDLEFLGHIEGLLNIKGKEVALKLEVSGEDAENAFRQNTIKLHKLLGEIGYKLANTTVTRLKSETGVGTAMQTLKEFEKTRSGGFDVRI